jgi:hypothetical protein
MVLLYIVVYRNVISKLNEDIMYLNVGTVKVAMSCTSMTKGLLVIIIFRSVEGVIQCVP